MAQKHILIVCGEPSGDLNAANLTQAIKEINPQIRISAVGGALLRDCAAEIIYDIKGLAVIGLFDVLKKLPKFLSLKKFILQKIKADKPQAIILVDFSGFNLRLAKKINKSISVIYYISPQVWASRPGRIKTIKKYIHKLLVLFKFEEEFYKKYGIDADFVGHPLLDIVKPTMEKKEFLNSLKFSESKTTIALLPGSRKQEIENILPIMLEASVLINKELANTQFVIAKSNQVDWDIYNRIIHSANDEKIYFNADLRKSNADKRRFVFGNICDHLRYICVNLRSRKLFERSLNNLDLKIIEGKTYDCLNIADYCLVASGTATLETAIMQKPFSIVYKMGLLNYLFYLPQVRVPYIGMVNIVAKRKIVPEFIQFQADPKKISEEALKILENPSEIARIKNELSQVKSQLGEKGASARAAKIIIDFIDKI